MIFSFGLRPIFLRTSWRYSTGLRDVSRLDPQMVTAAPCAPADLISAFAFAGLYV